MRMVSPTSATTATRARRGATACGKNTTDAVCTSVARTIRMGGGGRGRRRRNVHAGCETAAAGGWTTLRASVAASLAAATLMGSAGSADAAARNLAPVNRPDLLPEQYTTVIDAAGEPAQYDTGEARLTSSCVRRLQEPRIVQTRVD